MARARKGDKDPHDLAMWLQDEGYRLRDLHAAYAAWTALV